MNREDIIRMAWKAGFERLGHTNNDWVCYPEDIERFAALVASAAQAKEREACAKLCESEGIRIDASYLTCAEAIRARGNT